MQYFTESKEQEGSRSLAIKELKHKMRKVLTVSALTIAIGCGGHFVWAHTHLVSHPMPVTCVGKFVTATRDGSSVLNMAWRHVDGRVEVGERCEAADYFKYKEGDKCNLENYEVEWIK